MGWGVGKVGKVGEVLVGVVDKVDINENKVDKVDGVGVEEGEGTSERNRLTDEERVDECEKMGGDNKDTEVKAREEGAVMHKDEKEYFRSLGRDKGAMEPAKEAKAKNRERRKRQITKMNEDEETVDEEVEENMEEDEDEDEEEDMWEKEKDEEELFIVRKVTEKQYRITYCINLPKITSLQKG